MKSDKTSNLHRRMAVLLDRLNTAQNAVTGPPPTRVSFLKLGEWCAGIANVQPTEVYRDLLQSYLSGAFEKTLVFYLTNLAPDLTNTALVGYRMRRNFLAARVFSTDSDNDATAFFSAYLEPCWIHRMAAARWLESKGYPLPSQWTTVATSVKVPPRAQTIPRLKRKAPTRERVKNQMRADIAAGTVTIEELRRDKEAWANKYETGPTTAHAAAKELETELKAEATAASRSQSPDQERPENVSD
jgi:hypothetical protein